MALAALLASLAALPGCREPREQHNAKVTPSLSVDVLAPTPPKPAQSAAARSLTSASTTSPVEPEGKPGADLPTGLFTPGCTRTGQGEAWCWGAEPMQGIPTPFTVQAATSGSLKLQAQRVRALDFATSVASGVFTYFVDGRGSLWMVGTARNMNQPHAMHEYPKPVLWRPAERYEMVSSNLDAAGRADICALSPEQLLCWTESYLYDQSLGPFMFDRGVPKFVVPASATTSRSFTSLAVGFAGIYHVSAGALHFVGTQTHQVSDSPQNDLPFQVVGAPERLDQAGKVRQLAMAFESNQGCVLKDDRSVACFRRPLWGRDVAGSFEPVPGLADVVELSRGLAYYATLANGQRYVFRIVHKPGAKTSPTVIEPAQRVALLEGGQLLGDRSHRGPDCRMKEGRVVCWFELDAKTFVPKQLFEVGGLPGD